MQQCVRDFFFEMNYDAECEKPIQRVRGKKNADVWIQDPLASVNTTYLVECKHWNSPVDGDVVDTFRTFMQDSGANTGFIISKIGFQRGAYERAKFTNIHLLTWENLQHVYGNEWFRKRLARVEKLNKDWEVRHYFDEELNEGHIVINAMFYATSHVLPDFLELRHRLATIDVAVHYLSRLRYDENDTGRLVIDGLGWPVSSIHEYFETIESEILKWREEAHQFNKRVQINFEALSPDDRDSARRQVIEMYSKLYSKIH